MSDKILRELRSLEKELQNSLKRCTELITHLEGEMEHEEPTPSNQAETLIEKILKHYEIVPDALWIPAREVAITLGFDPTHKGKMRYLHQALKELPGVEMIKRRSNGSTPLRGFTGLQPK